MQLIFGITNKAKIDTMRKKVGDIIDIVGLNDVCANIPKVTESGSNPLENACIKAISYYDAIKRPVFSCDSGLYIDGLPSSVQIGASVKRQNGIEMTDEQMIEYYSNTAKNNGGQLTAQYKHAICLVINKNEVYELMDESTTGSKFIISSVPHTKRIKGFPIDSLSVNIQTGKYYLDEHNNDYYGWNHFREFFIKYLKGR